MRKMPRDLLRRIDATIIALARNPRPPGAKKLRGQDDRYRIRVGDYRVIYEVDDAQLLILIVEVGHRKDVYRP
jgi:mRNA interferase RelE/StbE